MKHRHFTMVHKIVLGALVLAFVVLFIIQKVNQAQDRQQSVRITPLGADEQTWFSFTDNLYSFSASYPETYSLNEEYVYEALGEDLGIPGLAVMMPELTAKQIGLTRESYFGLEVLPLFNSCSALYFARGTLKEETITEGEREYSVARARFTENGQVREETVYSFPGQMYCYGLRGVAVISLPNKENPNAEFDRTYFEEIYSRLRQEFKPL